MTTAIEIAAPVVCCLPLLVLFLIELVTANPTSLEEEQ